MSMNDPWILYSGTRDRLIDIVRALSQEEAVLRVPLTPDWTITDVVAHLCGLNADIAAGRRERLGSDERTARQVVARAGHSLEQICGEWLAHGTAMEQAMEEETFLGLRLAADLVVHLQDIQHALDLQIDRDDDATISAAHTYASIIPDRLVEHGHRGLVVELDDGSRFEAAGGSEGPTLLLRATAYDFLRSVTGRRSRVEVQALDWTGDPTLLLDDLSPYGPLRTVDAGI